MPRITLACLAVLLLSACATPGSPRPFFDEDIYARYYATEHDRVLRVERDGTVVDVTCLPPMMVRGQERIGSSLCSEGRAEVLGKAVRSTDGWDLSNYGVKPESGTCKPLFGPFQNEWLAEHRRSCWNRVWEIPAAVVVYPAIGLAAVGAVVGPYLAPLLLL